MFLLWWWSSHYGHCRFCQSMVILLLIFIVWGWVVRLSLLSFLFVKFLPFILFTVSTISSWQWRQCDVAVVVCLCGYGGAYVWVSRGGTDIERGYGDVRPWRPPFHASPAAHKGSISSKRVSSQDLLLRKFGNLASTASIFAQILALKPPNLTIFSSQAPKFGNFQLTSPQIWKFSVHKPPPFSEANIRSQAPHFRNVGSTPLPEKKFEWPPRGEYMLCRIRFTSICAVLIKRNVLTSLLTWNPAAPVCPPTPLPEPRTIFVKS